MVSHVDGGKVVMPTILFGVRRQRDIYQFDATHINAVDQLTPDAIFDVGRNSRVSNSTLPMPESSTRVGTARYASSPWLSLSLSISKLLCLATLTELAVKAEEAKKKAGLGVPLLPLLPLSLATIPKPPTRLPRHHLFNSPDFGKRAH
ncbi:hypothetical protein DID88_004550 [Monilinia fructigena]|uniref:Uncharacterized protein n=1 Tax=Monilinia fructigena TaxID=38457 RepID=A0A395IQY0_9HELO|nr:hypothetical protein DID88_004550 [Monilinia fructigena]